MREWVYPPVIRTALTLFRLLGIRFDLRGTDNVPASGGAVLASNHVSYLDFMFVGLPAHQGAATAGAVHGEEGGLRPSHQRTADARHAPHPRRPQGRRRGLPACSDALRGGELVGVFPEQTISRVFRAAAAEERRGAAGHRSRRTADPRRRLGRPADLDERPEAEARPQGRCQRLGGRTRSRGSTASRPPSSPSGWRSGCANSSTRCSPRTRTSRWRATSGGCRRISVVRRRRRPRPRCTSSARSRATGDSSPDSTGA